LSEGLRPNSHRSGPKPGGIKGRSWPPPSIPPPTKRRPVQIAPLLSPRDARAHSEGPAIEKVYQREQGFSDGRPHQHRKRPGGHATTKTTPIRAFGKGTDASPILKAADAIPRTKPPNVKPITEALRQERERWHESQQIRIRSCSLCPPQEERVDKPPPLERVLEPEEKWHRPHFHRQPTSRWQFALKSASEQEGLIDRRTAIARGSNTQ
jgi:hypothetical protein